MDVRSLATFLAVVDEGGVGAAADHLRVAQPSVSQTLRRLEREVGADLFHRVGRGLVLSAAGAALVAPARQVLRDLAGAEAAVAAVRGLEGGTLDLAALPTLAADPAARLVGAFRAAHPLVQVRLTEVDPVGGVEGAVTAGLVEVGLTELPVVAGLVGVALGEQDYVAVWPAGHRRRRRCRIADLADQPLVTTPVGTSTRRLVDAAFAAAGITPKVAVETAQREAIVPLVLSGAGLALLPAPLASTAAAQGAVVELLSPVLRRSIGLVHRDAVLSPAAAAFVQLATAPAPATATD